LTVEVSRQGNAIKTGGAFYPALPLIQIKVRLLHNSGQVVGFGALMGKTLRQAN
jgi:hypothetical protein